MKFGFGSTAEKNGIPRIDRVVPSAAIPGGELTIHGAGFTPRPGARPIVRFGEAEAALALVSSSRVIARVPENASSSTVQIATAQNESQPFPVSIAVQIADNLHPVANPVVDSHGNIYVTFSLNDPKPAQAEARSLAIADAKAKAGAMASAAGVKVGQVLQISDVSTNTRVPYPYAAAADSAPTQVPVGQIDVQVSVEVDFALG